MLRNAIFYLAKRKQFSVKWEIASMKNIRTDCIIDLFTKVEDYVLLYGNKMCALANFQRLVSVRMQYLEFWKNSQLNIVKNNSTLWYNYGLAGTRL